MVVDRLSLEEGSKLTERSEISPGSKGGVMRPVPILASEMAGGKREVEETEVAKVESASFYAWKPYLSLKMDYLKILRKGGRGMND